MSEHSVERSELLTLTSDIVATYAANNAVPNADLSGLLGTVFNTLSGLSAPLPDPEQKPVIPIMKSVTNKYIICLECGKEQKIIKRHLHVAHDTNPAEYRAKWGLANDYPMVTPVYAALRREIAKDIGLGRKRKF